VTYLEAALRAVPAANRLHYNLAMAYRGLGEMEKAKAHLERRGTVGLRPPDPLVDELQELTLGERVHLVRGRMAFAAERYGEAAALFQEAVDADPTSVRSRVNLGTALARSGDREGALAQYRKALELDPTMVEAWVNLGGVLLMRWEFAGCRDANLEAIKLDENSVVAHYNLGQAYLYLNDPGNLLKCNERVIELDREHAAAHYHAAVAQLALDNLGAAERHLGRAMELGHAPSQDFVKALEKAQMKKARKGSVTLVEITGAEGPDKPRED
jgi:tetratricopeptide (TPR) repeat protein